MITEHLDYGDYLTVLLRGTLNGVAKQMDHIQLDRSKIGAVYVFQHDEKLDDTINSAILNCIDKHAEGLKILCCAFPEMYKYKCQVLLAVK